MPEYVIGDAVDGYELTAGGWVPRLELDPSPYRPGDVVNGHLLTADLSWVPLRTAPRAPYRVGDLVEGYVLVPSGDWRPLDAMTRAAGGEDRRGARTTSRRTGLTGRPPAALAGQPSAGPGTASTSTRPTSTTSAAPARSHTQTQARTSTQTQGPAPTSTQTQRAAPTSTQTQRPAPTSTRGQNPAPTSTRGQNPAPTARQYRIGDTANGYVLTAAGWVPQSAMRPAAPGAPLPYRVPGSPDRAPAGTRTPSGAGGVARGPQRSSAGRLAGGAIRFFVFAAIAVGLLARSCS